MIKELFTIAQKIKDLREQAKMTQADLGKKLGLTRAAVNAWEMGISVPSTTYIIELSKMFGVSTDYLLGMSDNSTISIEGLTEKQVTAVYNVIECFREDNEKSADSWMSVFFCACKNAGKLL